MRNVRVHFSEYVMQMNPDYWPQPRKFDPERWQPGFNPEPFSYMPFFVGSRGCLGKHMAMMMMKLTLSVLAKNFEIQQSFNKKTPPTINQNMAVMRIINPVDCMVTPLSGS
jgi:cytochrome P450